MVVKTAFIGGPMYDPLYASINDFRRQTGIEVEVGFLGDHPALNHHLSALPDVPYDLISTHTKYALSQVNFLAPLDDLLNRDDLNDFAPSVLELTRVNGKLMALPRNIDVRLLHYRTDLIDTPPTTWDELLRTARQLTHPPDFYGFVFPGRESGLFGTFFELVESGGATLFPPDLIPQIENEGGRWALNLLRTMYAEGIVSPEIVNWHYDRVHDEFRNAKAAMIGDWPGHYRAYHDRSSSKVADKFRVVPYPTGLSGKAYAYGGGHTFALTHHGAQNPQALALLRFLTAPEQQLIEAQRGSVPVRQSVMTQIKAESTTGERERWETLEYVIHEQIIIPPKFAQYPIVEEVLWTTVQEAITGTLDIDTVLHKMRSDIQTIVRGEQV
jgi:multiple sugar transport system substrate-binding protein